MVTESPGWEPREGPAATVFDGKMWLMGGCGASSYFNDVWYSSDGINWTCATSAAPWSARTALQAVAFDGKMWMIGGGAWGSGFEVENDVWSSVNGVDWTEVTESAQWPGRMGHSVVVYDNKMWVLGGGDYTSIAYNDVWYSTDGENWTCSTASAPWTARESQSVVVFDNRIWVTGGRSASGTPMNDVWCTGEVGINEEKSAVESSSLLIFPNPIQGAAQIEFTVLQDAEVTVRIYDAAGRLVRHLLDQEMARGSHSIIWDGADDTGTNLSNGIYILRIETGAETVNRVVSLVN